MVTPTHKKLFTPVQVGAISLKHRVVMPPYEPAPRRVAERGPERPHARIL